MLPDTSIPRPTFSRVFAEVAFPDILHWIARCEARIGAEAYKEFIASLPTPGASRTLVDLLISLCEGRHPKPDAFMMTHDLLTVLNWPVDTELTLLIQRALEETERSALRQHHIAWTMKTGHRFHAAPGDKVVVSDLGMNCNRSVTILSVDKPTASAEVRYSDETIGRVYAEQRVR